MLLGFRLSFHDDGTSVVLKRHKNSLDPNVKSNQFEAQNIVSSIDRHLGRLIHHHFSSVYHEVDEYSCISKT